ncbi:GH3 auxin-responsive promoter family protein [Planctomycetota bacterium]
MTTLLGFAVKVLGRGPARELEAAAGDPKRAQQENLARVLRQNADTVFGREHGFSDTRGVLEYRRNVPICDFEYLRPYVEQMANGEPKVLTAESPYVFAATSGTTDKPKLIPVTRESGRKLNGTSRVWMRRALEDHPAMFDHEILTLVGSAVEGHTPGGIPYGSMGGITFRNLPGLFRRRFALPYGLMTVKSHDLRYYLAMRVALERQISFCAIPNPSTFLRLAKTGEEYADTIIGSIRDGVLGHDRLPHLQTIGEDDAERLVELARSLRPNPDRARELEQVLSQHGTLRPQHAWPHLRLIACWLGGSAGIQAKLLRDYYGPVPLRDLGLRASEAMMTIPVGNNSAAGLLTVHVNTYEFIPEEAIEAPDPPILFADELQIGHRYYIILTTDGGLYRYDINDIVEVRDFYRRAPLVAFLRKGRDMASLTGEKIHVGQIITAVERSEHQSSFTAVQFRMIPRVEEMRYDLLVEPDAGEVPEPELTRFLQRFDAMLGKLNGEYQYKRHTKRLGAPRLSLMQGGWAERQQRLDVAAGKRDVQYKWQVLVDGWNESSLSDVVRQVELGGVAVQSC